MILEPFELGRGKFLKNRIIIPSHSYNLTNSDGSPSEALVAYVTARIEGGAALIVLGETYVPDPILKDGSAWGASISSEKSIPIYSEIATIAHSNKCLIFDQLCHPGGQYWPAPGSRAYAPSPVAHPSSGGVPRKMTAGEIRAVVSQYSQAAHIARESGLDGVEIKADQGKLPHQFLSTKYNNRDDLYGPKGINGRLRFLMEVLEEVRQTIGEKMILGIRLPCSTYEPDDLSDEQCIENFKLISNLGLVDYVSLNGATNSTPTGYLKSHGDMNVPPITFFESAKNIQRINQQNSKLPIFLAGRIMTADDADFVLNSGVADVVAMARTHISDPNFVKKIILGLESKIRPCIGCNQSCVGNTWEGNPIRCIHNPEAGLEKEFNLIRENLSTLMKFSRAQPPVFLIVGAGVSGLEAARTALENGSTVYLADTRSKFGGLINDWSFLEPKRNFRNIVDYLTNEVSDSEYSLTFHPLLNHKVDLSLVRELNPDLVIDATGAEGCVQSIQRTRSDKVLHIVEINEDTNFVDVEKVIIQADSPLTGGLSLGIRLASLGIDVTLIGSQDLSSGFDFATYTSMMNQLRNFSNVQFKSFTVPVFDPSGKIQFRDLLTDKEFFVEFDLLVKADSLVPNTLFSDQLKSFGIPVVSIGDSQSFRGIEYSIRDGRKEVIKLLTSWYALRKETSWRTFK